VNELALFAGAGGGILGGKLLGWNTIGAVEIEKYPREVLLQRQRDGILPFFPIWDDITTFNGRPWKGCVDIISGGFPCTDISAAGKGAGIEGEKSGLWKEMARVIDEIRPRFAYMENSPMLTSRGLGIVLGDLAELGYNARWCVLGADDAGAPHRRKRIWILAYTNSYADSTDRRQERKKSCLSEKHRSSGCAGRIDRASCNSEVLAHSENRQSGKQKTGNRRESISRESEEMGDTFSQGLEGFSWNESDRDKPGRIGEKENGSISPAGIRWWDTDPADLPNTDKLNGIDCGYGTGSYSGEQSEKAEIQRCRTGATEPRLGRVAHGMAHRVDRLKAIGNGQVPAVAAIAFTILSEGLI